MKACNRCGEVKSLDMFYADRNRPDGRRNVCKACFPSTLGVPGSRPDLEQPFPERFWAKINKTETCWVWTGALQPSGYGRLVVHGKLVLAHRVSYELLVGPIPDGLTLDHLCRNRACVRPDHLEPVTMAVNTLRGVGMGAINATRTQCVNGHPFDAENTAYTKDGKRVCRQCRNRRGRENRARSTIAQPRVRGVRSEKVARRFTAKCADCGVAIFERSTRCADCAHRARRQEVVQ